MKDNPEPHTITAQSQEVLNEIARANFTTFGYMDADTGDIKTKAIALGDYNLYLLCAYNDDYMDGDFTHLLGQCNFDAWDAAVRIIRKYKIKAKHIEIMKFERYDPHNQYNVYEYAAKYHKKNRRFQEYIDPDFHFSNLMYYTDKEVAGITAAVLSE